MARSGDGAAGRADVRRALRSMGRQTTLAMIGGERRETCADPELRALLGRLQQGRSAGTVRLLAWLQTRGTGFGLETGLLDKSGSQRPDPERSDPERSDPERSDPERSDPERSDPAPVTAKTQTQPTQGQAVVQELRPVTDNLLIFKTSRPPGFDYLPGQSVKLSLGGVRRSYSIVSAPHQPFLEFFVELVPGGAMSARLAALRPGDAVQLPPRPRGSFVLDPALSRHLMVATVTGVNPFVGMLREHFHKNRGGQVFHLLQGASYQDEFGYRDELQTLATAHPQALIYRPTVSRPGEPRNAGWSGDTGRVDARVEAYLQEAGLEPGTTAVYACGNPGMVATVTARLGARGFRVRSEPYD